MDGKCSRLTEALAAFVAFEWLFFAVDVSMISQMVLSPKGLSANIAGIRSLISMRPFVYE